jgi:DNA-binding MarR family transcriptional regulator
MAEFHKTLRTLLREGLTLEVRPLAVLLEVASAGNNEQARLVGTVADGLGIPRPTVTRIASMFVDAGLMTRYELPHDRRTCVLHLTRTGRSMADAILAGGAGVGEIGGLVDG